MSKLNIKAYITCFIITLAFGPSAIAGQCCADYKQTADNDYAYCHNDYNTLNKCKQKSIESTWNMDTFLFSSKIRLEGKPYMSFIIILNGKIISQGFTKE